MAVGPDSWEDDDLCLEEDGRPTGWRVLPCSETSAQTLEPQQTVFHSWLLSVSGIHLVLATALCSGKGRSRFPQLAGQETGSQLAKGTHTRRQLLAKWPLLLRWFLCFVFLVAGG